MKKRFLTTLTVLAGGMLLSEPAFATLTFNNTFLAAWAADFGGNTAAATADVLYAESVYTSTYNDPINININFTAVTGTGTLGMSSSFISNFTYAALRAGVIGDAKSADDSTVIGAGGSLPAGDPTGGSAPNWWVTTAQAKALGLAADSLSNDGTITFGTGFTYTFDSSNRAVGGAIDFIGVVEHEISEVMGRIGLCGATIGLQTNSHTLTDAYAYSGAATRALNGSASNSFSIDNGTTLVKQWNDPTNGGDCRDWASGTNDAFNAFSSSGVKNDVTATDVRLLDVLGYDLAIPEPGTISLFAFGFAALLGIRVRRRVR